MMAKMFPTFLLSALTLLTDVHLCPYRPEEIDVKVGEMVVLQCPYCFGHDPSNDDHLLWTSYSTKEMHVINNMSSAETRKMLIHGRSLVIMITSINHQGNYSCSLGNTSRLFWFKLTVHDSENEQRNKHSVVCYSHESCTLTCPEVNNPDVKSLNISSFNDTVWHKQGESLPNGGRFLSVESKNQGDYSCTRSYLYNGQKYNMTSTVKLDVQPKENPGKPMILSPSKTNVVYVDLGSTVTIDCKAVVYSDFDELFWLSNASFVEQNESFPVFYRYSISEQKTGGKYITASLVFKNMSQEDLTRLYRCKLDSVSGPSSFVTVTLAPKAQPVSLLLTLSIVGILVVTAAIIFYVKFKIPIILFLRDTMSCHHSSSDVKKYDAFLLCYDSQPDAGLHEENVQWLEGVLEKKFGYDLCLYDRNFIQGRAEAEAVSDCIDQSRMVVFVPTSPGCVLGSAVVNDICAALLQRRNHLVFIRTKTTGVPTSGSLPQALELLSRSADVVTWKGIISKTHSSAFIKQLRYYLSAPLHLPKDRLLP